MLKKSIARLLICAVMLLTLGPSKVYSQTLSQPKAAESERALSSAQVKTRTGLKMIFAKELLKARASASSSVDYKRYAEQQQQPQGSKGGWSKKDKIFLAVFIVGMTALVTVLLIHGIDTSSPTCLDEPSNPNCI